MVIDCRFNLENVLVGLVGLCAQKKTWQDGEESTFIMPRLLWTYAACQL